MILFKQIKQIKESPLDTERTECEIDWVKQWNDEREKWSRRDQYSLLLWVFVIASNYLILNIQYTELCGFSVAFSLFIKSIGLDGHMFQWPIIFIWLISVFVVYVYMRVRICWAIYALSFDHLFGILGIFTECFFYEPPYWTSFELISLPYSNSLSHHACWNCLIRRSICVFLLWVALVFFIHSCSSCLSSHLCHYHWLHLIDNNNNNKKNETTTT